jgi:hypothetical protein
MYYIPLRWNDFAIALGLFFHCAGMILPLCWDDFAIALG